MAPSRKRAGQSIWTAIEDEDDENALPTTVHFTHTEINLNESGSSSIRTSHLPTLASPTKKGKHSELDTGSWHTQPPPGVDFGDDLDPAYANERFEHQVEPPPAKKKKIRGDKLRKWRDHDRDTFLDELLRLDGRVGQGEACSQCEVGRGSIRCEDCHGGQMLCRECAVTIHARTPLHRIEEWTGTFFTSISLKQIGLRIQLGHSLGDPCVNPRRAPGDAFVVIDINGIHEVALDFCECHRMEDHPKQLLRARWFPATVSSPQTAATFNLLEYFQLLTFESKASVFEYLNSLSRRTDNTGTKDRPDRYEDFLLMVREWRHLKMLKRAGRGHDPGGVAATKEGECAIICPACPQPGINLPADWREASPDVAWLFRLFLGADANMRMVRKKVSSEDADPTLSPGWSYFVETTKYKEHLANYQEQKETKSTCVKHHAVTDANGRFENLAASGLGTVDCIRHNFKRALSVGDLQAGERYVNMDYLYLSGLSLTDFVELVMSYDIVCQWSIHLWERMSAFPHRLQVDLDGKKVIFLVPKFHLPAHVASCQTSFSFNLIPKVGRTDGEAPERGWANINPISTSTKQMGPASRRETIDDHFGDWNHKKVIGLGTTLLRKLRDADKVKHEHVIDYLEFTDSLPAEFILEWTDAVELWEADPSNTNPFVPTTKTITQHGVRLALAEEDAAYLAREDTVQVHTRISASLMIAEGLDIESQQNRLKSDCNALDASATTLQLTKIQERKNSLHRKINTWTRVQHLYMPEVSALRDRTDREASDTTAPTEPYDTQLFLPSSLPRSTARACDTKLKRYEFRFREAQCYEALEELRAHLRLRTHMYKYKDRHLVGQSANTRCQNLLKKVMKQVDASAAKYRRARQAVAELSEVLGEVDWKTRLLSLEDADIRPLRDIDDADLDRRKKAKDPKYKKKGMKVAEGHMALSWIWKVVGVTADGDDKGLQEALRIEWCRVRARAFHWAEELLLAQEEMRRVLETFQYQTNWWESQARRRTGLSPEMTEGLSAYACKQAALREALRSSFYSQWSNAPELAALAKGAEKELLGLNLDSSTGILNPPRLDTSNSDSPDLLEFIP